MNDQHSVVFVIEALTVGGAEQMLVAMANDFATRGWTTHMVCLTQAGELAEQLDVAVTLHVLNKQSGVDLSLPRKLRTLVKSLKPTAVNSHLWTANLWTRLSLIGAGFNVVATEHSRDVWKPRHYLLIDRFLARFTHTLVAVSEDTADFYRTTVGVPNRLITVINNGIDAEKYAAGDGQEFRSEWAPNNEFLIGTVGRMVPAKNHPRLVDAAMLLKERLQDFKVLIVGDGPERAATEAYIKERGAGDTVLLAGARQDIPDVLSGLDLFVLSSDREGHPLTALEAQAAGTPVVLTKAGGSADAIAQSGGDAGGLLVERDAEALASAMETLASDSEHLAAMAAFGQHHALRYFTKAAMVEKYSDVFLH